MKDRGSEFVGLSVLAAGVFFFAIALIVPVWGDRIIFNREIIVAVRVCLSAFNTLSTGSFPLYYPTDFPIGLQPSFIYYAPGFYGLAGLLQFIEGIDAYSALLISFLLVILSIGFGCYVLSRSLGALPVAAGFASFTAILSPYLLTDFYGRGAIAELGAWAVVPWILACGIRFCRFPTIANGAIFSLTLTLLILFHKIFFPWVIVAFAVLSLIGFGPSRMMRLSPYFAIWTAISLTVVAPYWINPLLMAPELKIFESIGTVNTELSPLSTLLWPFPSRAPVPTFYLIFYTQLGAPITLAVILSIFAQRSATTQSLALTVSLFCILVSLVPSAVWHMLPTALSAIQFSYRLVLIVTCIGTPLVAVIMSEAIKLRNGTQIVALIVSAMSLLAFAPRIIETRSPLAEISTISSPNDTRDYFELRGSKPTPSGTLILDMSHFIFSGSSVRGSISSDQAAMAVVPVQFSRLLSVMINDRSIAFHNFDGLVGVELATGRSALTVIRVEPIGWRVTLPITILLAISAFWLHRRVRIAPAQSTALLTAQSLTLT